VVWLTAIADWFALAFVTGSGLALIMGRVATNS
jgi:hypothetical protein